MVDGAARELECHAFEVASARLREVGVDDANIASARKVLFKLKWFQEYVEHRTRNYT